MSGSILFGGHISGTSLIIDRFNTIVQLGNQEWTFLLSHAHKDHLIGLTRHFSRGRIYCSPITAVFLSQLYGYENLYRRRGNNLIYDLDPTDCPLRRAVHTLEMGMTKTIECGNGGETCQVTLIDANHVPGACMFLVQGRFGSFLHTGDFRYEEAHFARHWAAILPSVPSYPTTLYMDCTFMNPDIGIFPSRESACDVICDLIDKQSTSTRIYLACDMLGTEQVLIKVYERFHSPIYVDRNHENLKDRWAQLSVLTATRSIITSTSTARFHLVPARDIQSLATQHQRRQLMGAHMNEHDIYTGPAIFIHPSTMWYVHNRIVMEPGTTQVKTTFQNGIHHVLYSMHCDAFEWMEMVNVIRPTRVIALNVPVRMDDPSQQQPQRSRVTIPMSSPSSTPPVTESLYSLDTRVRNALQSHIHDMLPDVVITVANSTSADVVLTPEQVSAPSSSSHSSPSVSPSRTVRTPPHRSMSSPIRSHVAQSILASSPITPPTVVSNAPSVIDLVTPVTTTSHTVTLVREMDVVEYMSSPKRSRATTPSIPSPSANKRPRCASQPIDIISTSPIQPQPTNITTSPVAPANAAAPAPAPAPVVEPSSSQNAIFPISHLRGMRTYLDTCIRTAERDDINQK